MYIMCAFGSLSCWTAPESFAAPSECIYLNQYDGKDRQLTVAIVHSVLRHHLRAGRLMGLLVPMVLCISSVIELSV
eukprot:6229223-Amphidinium_carterae.1